MDTPAESYLLRVSIRWGSTSSIGQSHCSDIDIWVCHQSWLDQDERARLQRKCLLIEQWAGELGIDVTFLN